MDFVNCLNNLMRRASVTVRWQFGLRQLGHDFFEFCVWRAVSSHHPQQSLLDQFNLYVHKGGLKPHSFYFHLQLQVGENLNYRT